MRLPHLEVEIVHRQGQLLEHLLARQAFDFPSWSHDLVLNMDIKPLCMLAPHLRFIPSETGLLKIIDLGAAADLRVGINYVPKEFLLDPRSASHSSSAAMPCTTRLYNSLDFGQLSLLYEAFETIKATGELLMQGLQWAWSCMLLP